MYTLNLELAVHSSEDARTHDAGSMGRAPHLGAGVRSTFAADFNAGKGSRVFHKLNKKPEFFIVWQFPFRLKWEHRYSVGGERGLRAAAAAAAIIIKVVV